MYYDVPSRRNLLPMQSQNFSHATANAIAHHRRSQRLLHAHAETTALKSVLPSKNREIAGGAPAALAINGVKFRPPHQPPFARQIPLSG